MEKINFLKNYISAHKITSAIIGIVLIFSGYWGYGKLTSVSGETRYITATAEKGTLIVSISGTGQVSSSNQVDIKSKASGEITAVYAKLGQEVGTGAILAAVDASDAERAVRDAETALETAKLELDKMLAPLDALTLLQAENSLAQAKESKQNSEDNLKKAYEDGFNAVANTFLALPNVMTGLQNILNSSSKELGGGGQWNVDFYAGSAGAYNDTAPQLKQDVYNKYQAARKTYDENFASYKSASRFSDPAEIEVLINQTYDNVRLIAEAVKSTINLIQLYQDELAKRDLSPATLSNTHLASLDSYTGTTNSHLVSLLSSARSITDSQEAIVSASRTIEERELSLVKTKNGPDDLDIRAKKITIQQREDALTAAKQTLADHYVRAPFAGIIAKVNAKKGDSASAGTAVAILITKQKIAEVSLNEIDVAKIKADQKTTLTFDAVPDLSIAGKVTEVDSIGIVSQGVVTYSVKIGFDTQDERVKTGMSVSAAIITNIKQDVLLVPNSAVKMKGSSYYVLVLDQNASSSNNQGIVSLVAPIEKTIEIGLSDDSSTEIISGLSAGDNAVIRTITGTSATTQAPSILSSFGSNRGGAGATGR